MLYEDDEFVPCVTIQGDTYTLEQYGLLHKIIVIMCHIFKCDLFSNYVATLAQNIDTIVLYKLCRVFALQCFHFLLAAAVFPFLLGPGYFQYYHNTACAYIIESVDSISKDERGFPLTQYITNGRISRAG